MKSLACGLGLLLVATLTGAAHECERECVAGDTRTCQYRFNLQDYHSMSRACFDCPINMTDCFRPECVSADGVAVPILTINRRLPGPDLQARDRVVVDVYNWQLSDTETIHWHGQHMRGYQYFDGVPFITQCPIMGGIFRYDFIAGTPGTHWWHSHSGLHRAAGVFGAIVVRQADDQQAELYDELPRTRDNNARLDPHFRIRQGENEPAMPLEVVKVAPNQRYRLRLINTEGLNCPMVVSVDDHRLTIIASDGDPIVPYVTDSLVMYSGERFDVVLEANQPVDNYWIRFNGLIICEQLECVQGAVLRYEGAAEEDPTATLSYDSSYPPGVVVNPLNTGGHSEEEVTMAELTALNPTVLEEVVDKKFYLGFNFNQINDLIFYNPELYPFDGVDEKWQVNTPQLNNISFLFPLSPPLSQPDSPNPTMCLYGEEPPCEEGYCSCTYVLEVALGDTVEIVLIDEGKIGAENHPYHLHGYNFYVVGMERLGSETSVEEVMALDAAGGIKRNLKDAIRKDSVTIPDGGYTVVRFTADNPGWWLMHCHLIFHSEIGMVAVLHVGDPQDLPPVPEGFPTCSSFLPEV
ncbi:Laccase-like [Homarus americanus]|uniref:Laccase-like n=1 Tax=Homarus americanus TaxID=6706 RepID=A0A8J5N1J8_HOMAM|nr:Laccase-like [Homarus americanus]